MPPRLPSPPQVVFVGTSRSFVSHAAQMLIWARHGVLPPTISLEGDPLHTLLHARGRYWKRSGKSGKSGKSEDRGWIPCVYAWPQAEAACIACLNASLSSRSRDRCMAGSFARQMLGSEATRDTLSGRCIDSKGSQCSLGQRLD